MDKIIYKFKRYKNAVWSRVKYFVAINKLQIKNSGANSDGVPFIEIENGLIFYGFLSTPIDKVIYTFFIKKKIKNKLKKECVRVAFDIVFRFKEIENKEYYSSFKEGEIVLEIGAFIGYYVMRAATLVKNSGKVVGIEAIEDNYSLLQKNIHENNFNNVLLVQKASWDSTGVLKFYRHHRQRASAKRNVVINSNHETNIPCDTIDSILDDLGITHVDFIRIQVNGAELETLKGMRRTLKKCPKLSVAVIYEKEKKQQTETVSLFLKDLGYKTIKTGGSIFAYK